MTLITIDQDKCKRDGLCAADCPARIIRFEGKDSCPELLPNGEAVCLRCGHCVAVCPHGALDHVDVPLAECLTIDKALSLTKAQMEQFLRSRRSVRQFKKSQVPRETLQQLIEIARNAPTASNAQLVEWVVINDRDQVKHLAGQVIGWMRDKLSADPQARAMPYLPRLIKGWEAGADVILRDAPCLVVAMAPEHDNHGMVNLTLALSYLELAAPVFKLGTCWAGLLQGAIKADPALKQAVGIPASRPHHYPMMIGNAKVRYQRLPVRKKPRIDWK